MVELEPSVKDLETILKWYSLAFASGKTAPDDQDETTYRRVLTMKEEELAFEDSLKY